eukprot:1161695-Pelagomonas_calceolata.AAC.2
MLDRKRDGVSGGSAHQGGCAEGLRSCDRSGLQTRFLTGICDKGGADLRSLPIRPTDPRSLLIRPTDRRSLPIRPDKAGEDLRI